MGEQVRFGRYLLERRLAIGGMAEVFLGRIEGPEGFEKKVVIKRILPHLQHDSNHVQMFLDEARLAARFNHPNLIQVYELARIEDQYSLAMEYIDGEDVAAILDESLRLGRKPTPAIAAFIVAGAAQGLHYVHELRTDDGEPLNVVHRDISPANIIVTWSGGVKIVDFGIAKHDIATSNTAAGMLKGKFSYMSPEQARGERVDRRSDIFSLGTIFYELLTVSPCFTGSNQLEILDSVTKARYTPPKKLRTDIDPELVHILEKMLAAELDQRYETAAAVHDDLQRWLADTTIPTANDVGTFLSDLFGRTSGRQPNRVRTAIQDWDEVPVTEELSSPEVMTNERSYRMLVDSQALGIAEIEAQETEPVGRRPGARVEPLPIEETDVEPFEMPPRVSEPLGVRRRSAVYGVADRLREPRYWPTTLAIMTVSLLIAASAIVMVYRAAVGGPWRPTEILPALAGGGAPSPRPGEVVGAVTLHIETVPSGARVTVDGEVQEGRTPLTVDNLALGVPHNVVAEMDGHLTTRKTLTLSGTQMQALTLTLLRDRGSAQTATVSAEVTSDPPGALILIDGQRTEETTPATIQLEAGRPYVVSAELGGYAAGDLRITAFAGEPVDMEIPLQKVAATGTGLLTLESWPKTDVFIGGRKVGSTPLRRHAMPAGRVLVQLKHARMGLSKTLQLTIPADETLHRKVSFKKGSVLFDVRPWADVYLRRKKLGTTPMPPVTLYEGTYAIRLVNPELGVEKTIQVTVRGGKSKKVVEKMR